MSILEVLRAYKSREIDTDAFFRAVVEYPSWHVAVDDRQHPRQWLVGDKRFIAVMAEPSGPGEGPHHDQRVGGRHLVRNLPKDADGAGFEMSRPHGFGLTLDDWPRLLKWANILDSEPRVADLEDRLESPEPDQAERLHRSCPVKRRLAWSSSL